MNIFMRGIRRIIYILADRKLLKPKHTAMLLHAVELKRWPDLRHPKDLNEKIMWLSYNTDTSEWSRLADKYAVREFVTSKGYGDILIPLIGVYDSADDIDFDSLPDEFVIKSTHASGQNIIVRNKATLDIAETRKKIRNWFSKDFGRFSGEIHYLKIKPRIIIEKRLPFATDKEAIDYKFMCCGGKPRACLVCSDRDYRDFHCHFSLKTCTGWQNIEAVNEGYKSSLEIKRPDNLEKMLEVAEKLSADFPFVRVDLYETGGKIYFGEMTFTPVGGHIQYLKQDYLLALGNEVTLPEKKIN